jgi:GH25 family lysozyme M1 (1,4-beta-N-acetylmuramidase)
MPPLSMRPRRLLAAVVLAVVLGPVVNASASVSGPDVSSYQHPLGYSINWTAAKVSGGASFAFVKATEGGTYTNPYFARDFAALRASGLIRGAYHFANPTASTTSAVTQAKHFVAVAGTMSNPGDLPPVLDLEVNNGLPAASLIAWTRSYLNEIKALTGRDAIIYSAPYFWRGSMANTTAFTSYPLWVASYSSTVTLFGGWRSFTFWQYTDHANLPGLPPTVDMSVFNGNLDRLNALANRAPASAPSPKPAPTPTPTPSPKPAPAPAPTPKPPLPGTPSVLTASHSVSGSITLTWTAPTNAPITGYRLRIDSTPVRTLAPSTRYVLVGLALGQMHQVVLAAANITGTGPPASLRVPITAPTRLDVTTLALPRDRVQLNFSVRRTDLTRGLAAAPVTVQLRPRVGAAPKPFTVTTDTTGGGTVTLQPSVTTDVRLSYPGTTLLTTSTTTLVLTVRPVLTAHLSVSQVRPGATATLSGATRATLVGALIYRQGFYGGGWHTWALTTVKPDGTYTFTIRPTVTVNYYRLWLPGTLGYASAASPTLALRTK